MRVWIARNKGSGDTSVIISTGKLIELEQDTKRSTFAAPEDRISFSICYGYWRRLGGPRLQPGDGPYRKDVQLLVTRKHHRWVR
jgi:hypothetical protein